MSDMADRIINMRYLRLFRVLIKFGFIQATAYPPAFLRLFQEKCCASDLLWYFSNHLFAYRNFGRMELFGNFSISGFVFQY